MDEQQDPAAALVAEWWAENYDRQEDCVEEAYLADLEGRIRQLVAQSEQNARESLKLAGESYAQGYRDGVQVEREACERLAEQQALEAAAMMPAYESNPAAKHTIEGSVSSARNIARKIRARGSE